MWPWKRKTPEERVHELVSQAEQALEAREFERALNVAREIIDLHHTYGFELAARALSALDREPEALRLMEDSVTIAPEVGKLWSHLGEYRSNAGDYAGARAAFERAGALDPEFGHESLLNVAITYSREGQLERAWSQLELIPQDLDGELGAAVAVHRAKTLVDLGRHEQALEFCARELEAREAHARAASEEPNALRNARQSCGFAKAFVGSGRATPPVLW